jgi:hypothetical protein
MHHDGRVVAAVAGPERDVVILNNKEKIATRPSNLESKHDGNVDNETVSCNNNNEKCRDCNEHFLLGWFCQ